MCEVAKACTSEWRVLAQKHAAIWFGLGNTLFAAEMHAAMPSVSVI